MIIGVKPNAGLQARALQGDGHAFGELIAEWDDDLRGLVWSIVRSAPDTDDVMQRSYEKAFTSLGSFRSDSSLKTWLHSICYRTALDHVRYERRRTHESLDVLGDQRSPQSPSDEAIAKTELAAALDQLAPDARALLMLTAGLGYTFDETAEISGFERGTVASKVARAKAAIRAQAERDETEHERTLS